MDMPVVGRGRVLDELARLGSEATAGGGALVLVSGEAGIGKTTMLSCLAQLAGATGIPVLAGRAAADEGAPAFWPWLRVLGQGQKLGLSPTLLELGDGPAAQARFVAAERTALALIAAAAPCQRGRLVVGAGRRHPPCTRTVHRRRGEREASGVAVGPDAGGQQLKDRVGAQHTFDRGRVGVFPGRHIQVEQLTGAPVGGQREGQLRLPPGRAAAGWSWAARAAVSRNRPSSSPSAVPRELSTSNCVSAAAC
jgi:hypothetical protein